MYSLATLLNCLMVLAPLLAAAVALRTGGWLRRSQRLATAPLPVELLWWLGAGTVVAGSLLYPISLRATTTTTTTTVLVGAGLLLGATGWHYHHKRQTRPRS